MRVYDNGVSRQAEKTTSPPVEMENRPGISRTFFWATAQALLFGLAFPPFSFWPAVLFCLYPLTVLSDPKRKYRYAGFITWFMNTLLFLFEHRWQIPVSALGYPFGAALMGMYPTINIYLLRFLRKKLPKWPVALLLPMTWAAVEVLRGEYLFYGYGFFLLGHPMINFPAFPQFASLLGTYAVSALTAMPAGALADLISEKHRLRRAGIIPGTITLLLIFSAVIYGEIAVRQGKNDKNARVIRMAAVQTNVPQDNKLNWTRELAAKDFVDAVKLTRLAAEAGADGRKPDIICWPETMVPMPFGINDEAVRVQREFQVIDVQFYDKLTEEQIRTGIPFLVGAEAVEGLSFKRDEKDPRLLWPGFGKVFNSVFLIENGKVEEKRYDKIHLTPFGEILPYVDRFPVLNNAILRVAAGGMRFDLSPGKKNTTLQVSIADKGTFTIATPICFEATSDAVCRRLSYPDGKKNADILVNITNDGWFGPYRGGREQHLQAARFRCIELRLPMLRVANTGISAGIDSNGEIIAAGPANHEKTWDVDGVLTVDLQTDSRTTFFGRLGTVLNLVYPVCLLLLLLISFSRVIKDSTRDA